MLIVKAVSAAALAGLVLGGWKSSPPKSAHPDSPPVVTLTSRDYSFDPIPNVPAGVVELRLHNAGKDFHHAAIFRLFGGKTAADLEAALKKPGPPPAWARPVPGPNAPVPGGISNVTVLLSPGKYAVVCFIDTNGGVPHFMKGMVQSFSVVPSRNKSKAPRADLSLKLFDYGFRWSKAVVPGSHTIRVVNVAKQTHEIEIFRLAPGKTQSELHSWLLSPMTTPPPAMPIGGVMNVPPGGNAVFQADLPAGNYSVVCFVPDAKDGKPHFLHGMEQAVTVR